MNTLQPYCEINLSNLSHNVEQLSLCGYKPETIVAVVKDNAYGCGAVDVARVLAKQGVKRFAVARLSEALELSNAGISGEILILGECTDTEIIVAAQKRFSLAINGLGSLQRVIAAHVSIPLHLNFDTGMSRLGILPNEIDTVLEIVLLHNCNVRALMTHFSCADSVETSFTKHQYEQFSAIVNNVKLNDISFSYCHCSNSAGILYHCFPEPFCMRPGILLYGNYPDPSRKTGLVLKPVLAVYAPVVKIKQVDANTPISYGARFVTKNVTNIATIPIGYAHGVPRALTGTMTVLIKGVRYPVVGTITMDYIMVDLGLNKYGVTEGDRVTIIGVDGDEEILLDDYAAAASTISYEVQLSFGRIQEKRYVD